MTSVGLAAFEILCRCATDLEALREKCDEGGVGWVALTHLTHVLDSMIDQLVYSQGLDDDEEDDGD